MRWLSLILLALASLAFGGEARAQSSCPASGPTPCDQGEAYLDCLAVTAGINAPSKPSTKCQMEGNNSYRGFRCAADGTGCGLYGLHAWKTDSSCASRNQTYPPGNQTASAIPIPRCYGGCEVLGTEYKYSQGGISLYGMTDRYYSGSVCSAGIDANAPIDAQAERDQATKQSQPECTALGNGQTACVKPDGDYCATASNGKTHCWTPNEEGVKVDGEDAQRKSEQGKPVLPPDVSIPDKDWQRKEGHQSQACVNNTCKTYNITNYSTVAAGTAKNSTGDNKADGTGNTSGNGTSTGSGSGSDDEGDSASESGNCDTPPACTGDTLKCLHLKITWRIDCNTKGNEITDSNGCGAGDVPVCAGKSCKAEQYATLLRDWRRRCEFVADAQNGVADGQGDDEAGVIGGLWSRDGEPEPEFDTGKVSVGGGGDLFPEVQIYGTTFSVPPSWYDLIAKIRLLVIASFMIAGFWIVARM